MRDGRSRLSSILTTIFVVIAFFLISSLIIIWANGLHYNPKSHKFEQTVVLAIDENLQDVSVKVNNELVATKTPWQGRDLNAGQYKVVIEKNGFFSFEKNFSLSPGQVGLVKSLTLIANPPKVTPQEVSVELIELVPFDSQLTIVEGELLDHGDMITRFSQSPVQVHRLNEDYLYQQDRQLRLFVPNSNQDFLLFTLDSNLLAPLKTIPSVWQVVIKNSSQVLLLELTTPNVTSPTSRQ